VTPTMSKKGEEPQWDQDFEPLMKVLLGKKGIKTKSASEIGRKKVDYFRGKDFKKWAMSSEELLKKKCPAALKAACDGKPPEDDKDVERLGSELIQRNFCYKALYKPINPTAKRADEGAEKKEKKWPDRLARSPNQSFDCEGFYAITYEGGSGMKHFLLALLIAGVLLICMFPVWPMWAKIGIWYLSVLFLAFYFGVLIIRMIVYAMFWIVGFDFWIYPNLNDEYCGFLDSFRPMYSWEKRKDDPLMLLVRFGSLAITAVAVHQIAETTSLEDVNDFFVSSYMDVLDWGVEKLALPDTKTELIASVEDLMKDNATDATEDDLSARTAAEAFAAEQDDDDAADGASSETINVDAGGGAGGSEL